MRCSVCRREYFAVHDCAGELYMGDITRPESGPLFFYYVAEAFRILKLDRLAIRRIEHDRKSLFYSVPIWILCVAFSFLLIGVLPSFAGEGSQAVAGPGVSALSMLPVTLMLGVLLFAQIGIFHLFTRVVFSGQGTFVRVLRPCLLGATLPIVFTLFCSLGGIWSMLVYAWVFEEVEGISRIQAIGISVLCNGIMFLFVSGFNAGLRAL